MQQDVSGKDVERIALYNFATDDVLPDLVLVEIGLQEALRLSSSALFRARSLPEPHRTPSGAVPESLQYCIVLYSTASTDCEVLVQ